MLQHNEAAVSVYRKLGFEVRREFNYFRAQSGEVKQDGDVKYEVRRMEAVPDSVARGFWDFDPSWQNSFEAICRVPEDFIYTGVFESGAVTEKDGVPQNLVGYGIFEPASGDITQISVAKTHRHRGIGSALLAEMMRHNRARSVKCVNTEIGRDETLAGFLGAKNIALAGKQFEMIKCL